MLILVVLLGVFGASLQAVRMLRSARKRRNLVALAVRSDGTVQPVSRQMER
jgi:hypothetical protein